MSEEFGKGYIPRDFQSHPLGSIVCAPRASIPIIPRSEWKDIIEYKTATNSWILDRLLQAGFTPFNQQQLPWCHGFSLVGAAEAAVVNSGKKYVRLSPASVAGPTTGWQMKGAYIFDDLKVATDDGIAEASLFGTNETDPRKYTPEVRANAKKHRVVGVDLDTHNWDEIVSATLADIPMGVGCNRHGHAVFFGIMAKWIRGQVILPWMNSWGTWGNNGMGEATEGSDWQPDEAYGLLSCG